nr:zf-HC2 domain-containing protein [Paenibacillus puerhi]
MCQEVIELMQRYLDRDLEETEYRRMLGHLQQCPDCSELFERLVHVSTELESLPKVMPPYSLVDAILPEIERMEAGIGGKEAGWLFPAQEEAAGQSAEQPDDLTSRTRSRQKLGWRGQVREWISFPVLGGVVAAGLIFGFFAFQQDLAVKNKMAEEVASKSDRLLSTPQLTNKASTGSSDSLSAAGSNRADATTAPPAVEGGGGQQPFDASQPAKPEEKQAQPEAGQTPATEGQPSGGTAPKPAPGAGAVQPPARAETPKSGEEDRKPAASSALPVPQEPVSGLPSPGEQKIDDQQGAVSKGLPPSGSVNGDQPPVAGTPADGRADEINRPMGLAVPDERESAQDPNNHGSADRMIGPSYTISGIPSAPKHDLPSKDGNYQAVVKDNQVFVHDKSGKEVYASKFDQWNGADRIELVEWNGPKLKYAVKMNEQTRTFEIDLETLTEIEIKN